MNKILLIPTLIIVTSCSKILDDTPKCSDEDVLNTVTEIYDDKYFADNEWVKVDSLSISNITNIRTMSVNEGSKSCECNATIEMRTTFKNSNQLEKRPIEFYYTSQRNSEGNLYTEMMENKDF